MRRGHRQSLAVGAGSAALAFGATMLLLSACATALSDTSGSGPSGGGDGGVDPKVCPSCVTDTDCSNGDVCAQFGSDIYCAAPCPKGDECGPGTTCTAVTNSAGDQASVCVPDGNACGQAAGPGGGSGGGSTACAPLDAGAGDPNTCGTLVGPTVKASCTSCTGTTSGGHTCQANGCYGGWWCDTPTSKCHAPPPAGCGTGGGGSPTPNPNCSFDAGGTPISGTVGANGGSVSNLFFAIVGDTRPPVINDTSGYPSAVIGTIYSHIASLNPMPPFAVSTGDYVFATANGGPSAAQFALYQAARAKYPGTLYPAMGNHECTGAVTSNCGASGIDGTTDNYANFLSKMLEPIGQTNPYYAVTIAAEDKTWNAKFVFVAGNAWDTNQASWLEATLAHPTTYTFVVRHEPSQVTNAPGVRPSEQIMAAHPYTLAIVGHTHTYGKTGARQITVGNGGAPLTGTANYGFGLVLRRADGSVQIDMIDYQSGQADPSFHFALHPDGSPAP